MNKDYSDHIILLKSLRENDYRAFSYLYNKTRNRLFVIAYLIIRDKEAARDIVHDFFADFLENRLFENITSITTFLVQSVKNKAINYKKRQELLTGIKSKLASQKDIASPVFQNEELKKELDMAISKLPPMAAKVFLLRYAEDLNYNEISIRLGISKSTVSSHLDRALKGLRAELKQIL